MSSRDTRKDSRYFRDRTDRGREPVWGRSDYRRPLQRKRTRSRSPPRDLDKRRSRSPRKPDKDVLDENILSEISKLPEPSELWDTQFQEGGFAVPPGQPPPFPQETVSNPSYGASYQPSYSGIYDDFPPVASMPQPAHPDMASWNQMSLPPPPVAPTVFVNNVEDQIKKEAAIESEMRHQKAALSKQREDYMKKAGILKKELDTLKDQRNELRGDAKRSPSPDTKRFLKENTKLQLEIQNKLKTINNVVDMLNGIIGEDAPEMPDSDDSDRGSNAKRKSRSPSAQKFNYVYYDPEMHWCRVCNEFPSTAKDYLNHLHSPAHHKMAAAHLEAPWHSVTGVNEGFANNPSAPTKRTPIRGLQFFVPSTAWYCKLCDQFIGDLHCASAHLKSITHSKNYQNFVEQNPHWETDWMSDRQKAFEKSRAAKGKVEEKPPQYTAHTITFNKDGFHTKKKDSPPPPVKEKKKEKKKKVKRKKSSSSSSASNSSSSESEPHKKKKSKSKKVKAREDLDDKTLKEWMSAIPVDMLNESDRTLLDNLKSRALRMHRIRTSKAICKDIRTSSESTLTVDRMKGDTDEKRRSPSRSARDRGRSRSASHRKRNKSRSPSAGSPRRSSRSPRARRRSSPKRTPPRETKKPEVKKMPFIGKMPVYKHLGKINKNEDNKKEEEQKKKEEEDATKKRREEMDAEIQKKVAEFKDKIAKAQRERELAQQQLELPPPLLALPTQLGSALPPATLQPAALPPPLQPPLQPAPPPTVAPPPAPAPTPLPITSQPPPQPPPPALPKDFQEALDIIFPTEVKADVNQDLFPGFPPGFPMGPLGMPPFPLLQPQMFGFDLNAPLFPPRPQLYDSHVPLVPSPKLRPQNIRHRNQNKNVNQNKKQNNQNQNNSNNQNQNKGNQNQQGQKAQTAPENGSVAKKKEELDDMAMLGIDASDVGAM